MSLCANHFTSPFLVGKSRMAFPSLETAAATPGLFSRKIARCPRNVLGRYGETPRNRYIFTCRIVGSLAPDCCFSRRASCRTDTSRKPPLAFPLHPGPVDSRPNIEERNIAGENRRAMSLRSRELPAPHLSHLFANVRSRHGISAVNVHPHDGTPYGDRGFDRAPGHSSFVRPLPSRREGGAHMPARRDSSVKDARRSRSHRRPAPRPMWVDGLAGNRSR